MNCPYKYILGIPEKGFHATRLFGLALNDTLGTIVLALIVSYIYSIPIWKSIVGMFVLGEVLHYLFGVQTAFLTSIDIKAC